MRHGGVVVQSNSAGARPRLAIWLRRTSAAHAREGIPGGAAPVLLALVALVAGCGAKPGDDLVAGFRTFKQQMCACKTPTCAKQVNVGFEAFSTRMRGRLAALEAARAAAVDRVVGEYFQCLTDLEPPLPDLDEGQDRGGPNAPEEPGDEVTTTQDAASAAPADAPPRAEGQYEMKRAPVPD